MARSSPAARRPRCARMRMCSPPTWARARTWRLRMAERLIDARGIQTFYGSSHILRGIDFHVDRGETIGLMGRNGMGKSTLLKSLMGIVRPRAGTVQVKGRDMVGRPPYAVAQL